MKQASKIQTPIFCPSLQRISANERFQARDFAPKADCMRVLTLGCFSKSISRNPSFSPIVSRRTYIVLIILQRAPLQHLFYAKLPERERTVCRSWGALACERVGRTEERNRVLPGAEERASALLTIHKSRSSSPFAKRTFAHKTFLNLFLNKNLKIYYFTLLVLAHWKCRGK